METQGAVALNVMHLWPECVATGDVVELGHHFYRGMPGLSSHAPYVFSLYKSHGDFFNGDGTSATSEVLFMGGHTGTHIDAVGHISQGMMLHGGLDAGSSQSGMLGLKEHGIETTEPLILRGTLIDACGEEPLANDAVVGIEAVVDADVRPGDAVLIRTGWARYFDRPNQYADIDAGIPGLGVEAARWLADRQVRLIGADNIALEPLNKPISGLPVHALLLVERGIQIVEMLNLEELARRQVRHFLFIALPLPLRGGTASPIRPIAIT